MTSETEINKIIIRQLQKHNLKYNCYFDPDENGDVISCFDWDNFPHILDEKCIFAECSDSELILLFNAVIDRQPLDWDIITEICKMLLIKGDLIEDKLKKIIFDSEFDYSNFQRLLAYLGSSLQYETAVIDWLDRNPEDFRDGLFMACYHLNTPAICRKLLEKFTEWIKENSTYGAGTGEDGILERFIEKWDQALPADDLQQEFLDFKELVREHWAPLSFSFSDKDSDVELEGCSCNINIFVCLFYEYIVRYYLMLKALFVPRLYEIKVVSPEEFAQLNKISSREELLTQFSEQELRQEFDFCEAALQKEFSQLPGKWEMSDDYSDFFHCGGIYTNNMLSPRYVNAIIKAFEKTAHPDKWYYHTACEIYEDKYPLLGFGEMLLHDRVLYVPDDGNNYTDFF